MAGRSVTMNEIKEVLRRHELGESDRSIAKSLRMSRNTVKAYIKRAQNGDAGPIITVPKIPDWTLNIDWEQISSSVLLNKSTIEVIWEEEVLKGNCSVNYSGFWKQYNKRYPDIAMTMHKRFLPGERAEIDYCDGIDIIIPSTGEIVKTHLFVGVLCNSRYPFAEFSLTQKSDDFLNSHVRMFEYFGGVPAIITPDNLKSAVNKAHRYDPEINQAYTRLAEYYGFIVAPARSRTPKDKAIVERTIQIFQRWFFSRVRNKTFTCLIELNKSLHEHLAIFIHKIHRIFKMSRADMFKEEKGALKPLPESSYIVATHTKAKLHTDCHLEFDKHFYSAPWSLRGNALDVWATEKSIEIYHNGERVAFHGRLRGYGGKFSTKDEHYPERHRAYLETTPCSLRDSAQRLGPNIYELIDKLLNTEHPLGFIRRAQGILALSKKYSNDDLDVACAEALKWDRFQIRYIERVIKQYRSVLKNEDINRADNPYYRGNALYH